MGCGGANWVADPLDVERLVDFLYERRSRVGQGGNFDDTVMNEAAVHMASFGPPKKGDVKSLREIRVDGHEKLGEKALRMDPGIGIDVYGMRDHVGKVLLLKAVPNSRRSDTVGHLFLDMVSDFQATSVQVTFDGGSELGWLVAFQTTLREVFAPELSADEWRPVVAVKSTSNISIESTWSYDRQFNGRSLFRWLWSKIVQTGLDEFVDYFNNKKTRKQRNRILPSGVAPNVVFDMPANYGLENLAIPVTQEALDELRGLIDTPREDAFRWVSDEFDEVATAVYIRIGSPKLEALSGWAIFNGMAPLLRGVVVPGHL
ncbi:hypothetical protein B0H10DRAFT_1954517 [Mycena sp. CBHHK59/15]|nr:hypothetical protein B0H10DRAFT_1954517 [Mycena sp. CBHHK59/15]